MQNIFIFLPIYDPNFSWPSWIELVVDPANNDNFNYTNRVNKNAIIRSPNIDTKSVIIVNNGHVREDRNFNFNVFLKDENQINHLLSIFELSIEVFISTDEGLFKGYFSYLKKTRDESTNVFIYISEVVFLNKDYTNPILPDPWVSIFSNQKWEPSDPFPNPEWNSENEYWERGVFE